MAGAICCCQGTLAVKSSRPVGGLLPVCNCPGSQRRNNLLILRKFMSARKFSGLRRPGNLPWQTRFRFALDQKYCVSPIAWTLKGAPGQLARSQLPPCRKVTLLVGEIRSTVAVQRGGSTDHDESGRESLRHRGCGVGVGRPRHRMGSRYAGGAVSDGRRRRLRGGQWSYFQCQRRCFARAGRSGQSYRRRRRYIRR
jgi:hypothetical protein